MNSEFNYSLIVSVCLTTVSHRRAAIKDVEGTDCYLISQIVSVSLERLRRTKRYFTQQNRSQGPIPLHSKHTALKLQRPLGSSCTGK